MSSPVMPINDAENPKNKQERVNENGVVSNSDGQLPTTSLDSLSLLEKISRFAIISVMALFSSLSIFVFIIVLRKEFGGSRQVSFGQKIAEPAVPWLLLSMFRFWLLMNKTGHRLNGKVDEEMLASDESSKDDPWHVAAALIANIPTFTSFALVVLIGVQDVNAYIRWPVAILLGTLNYFCNLFTDIPDSFRKHVDHCKARNIKIKHYHEQPLIRLIYTKADLIGAVGREVLLPLMSLLTSIVVIQFVEVACLAASLPSTITSLIKIPTFLVSYLAMAGMFTGYELEQFDHSMKAANKEFHTENYLSQETMSLGWRILGKIQSGQIVVDVLRYMKFSTLTSVKIALVPTVITVLLFLARTLNVYVSSNSANAVGAGQEGVVMDYYFGKESALELAKPLEPAIIALSAGLSTIGIYARSATIYEHARKVYHEELPRAW